MSTLGPRTALKSRKLSGSLAYILAQTNVKQGTKAAPNDVAGCTLEMGADGKWVGALGSLSKAAADALYASGALANLATGATYRDTSGTQYAYSAGAGWMLVAGDIGPGSPSTPFATIAERTAWATANLSSLRSGASTAWGPGNVEFVWNGPLATDWVALNQPDAWTDYEAISGREKQMSYSTFVATYTGNGSAQSIALPFEPTFLVVRGGTAACRIWVPNAFNGWALRGDAYAGDASIDVFGAKMTVGEGMSANGVTYHYLAIYDPYEVSISDRSYKGNLTASVYSFFKNRNLAAALYKRDNVVPMHFGTKRNVFKRITGAEALGSIKINTDGTISVSADEQVNNGEGNSVIGFFPSQNISIFEYTSAVSTTIFETSQNELEAFILLPHQATAHSAIIWFSTDATNAYSLDGGAAESGIIATMDRGRIGIAAGQFGNAMGLTYTIIAFGKVRNAPQQAPAILRSGNASASTIFMGAGHYIDCGVSDTLAMKGPATFEWFGACYTIANATSIGESDVNLKCLFSRAGGTYGVDNGNLSFGSWFLPSPYAPSYSTYWVGVKSYAKFIVAANYYPSPWQTGVRPNYRTIEHFVATVDSDNRWKIYRNGLFVKEYVSNIGGLERKIGHRMVMGAMWDGSAFVGSGSNAYLSFSALRIYSRALSDLEVKINLKSCATDGKAPWIVDGLVEGWLARDSVGTSLPALIHAENNGTIVPLVKKQLAIT